MLSRGANNSKTVQLEFELAYFEATVQHFSHYAMGDLPTIIWFKVTNDNHL